MLNLAPVQQVNSSKIDKNMLGKEIFDAGSDVGRSYSSSYVLLSSYTMEQAAPALKRGVNPTTTFIRQKEGWISDRIIDTVVLNQSFKLSK